jgi:hypothetical protein
MTPGPVENRRADLRKPVDCGSFLWKFRKRFRPHRMPMLSFRQVNTLVLPDNKAWGHAIKNVYIGGCSFSW